MTQYIDILCDGPPSHEAGRFVEVENDKGASLSVGEWMQEERDKKHGFWRLRIRRDANGAFAQESVELESFESNDKLHMIGLMAASLASSNPGNAELRLNEAIGFVRSARLLYIEAEKQVSDG